MRLIDADNIKKKIASVAILSLFDRMEISPEKLDSLIKMIDMEETAYDVDKVVEQIEIKSRGNWGCHSPIELEDAVDIVTSGGLEKRSSENN